jgi:hypothetical protein
LIDVGAHGNTRISVARARVCVRPSVGYNNCVVMTSHKKTPTIVFRVKLQTFRGESVVGEFVIGLFDATLFYYDARLESVVVSRDVT